MQWRKLGLVYGPDGTSGWAKTHCMIPTPVRLNEEVVRVFVTFCDADGVGRPGYVDVAAIDPTKVLAVSREPLFDIGAPGTFDDNGAVTCSVVPAGEGRWHMYYVGFELCTKVRYRLFTGLAISDDGTTFRRSSQAPVLDRTDAELHFRCGPWCVNEDGLFRLWYVAGSAWIDLGGKAMPIYDLRYAESPDGVNWPAEGQVQLPISKPDEHGFGRPCIIGKTSGGYRMFYSVRRKSVAAYRLGYAESEDGRNWERRDEALNLDVTPGSFDSDAIMYAAPLQIGSRLYVFYNGNDFGREGFAVAVLEEE